jgi:release factor glutamine methyltransferase
MTNSKILYHNLIQDLNLDESEDEISAIAFEVLDHFGISKTDILTQKITTFNYEQLTSVVQRLNKHEPVQYVLGKAWFCGHKFSVNPSVLIPRPETAMLVEEALKFKPSNKDCFILDIGTVSGCIAISLALMFPDAQVKAIDISEDALRTAKQNARNLNANVDFINHNILTNDFPDQEFDLIVSNPPYIGESEMNTISRNVIDYEPHLARFIKEPDPLIFYRAISIVAARSLKPGGQVLRIRTGQVDINGGNFNPQAPFGGFKQSGRGREFGTYGFEEFLEIKSMQL